MPSNTTAIWILCVTFCVFLLLRFPVALVLVISSIATLWYLDMPIVVVAQQTLQGINLFSLLAIPFFIMTGQLLGAGGLANRIVDFANVFVGRLPGGIEHRFLLPLAAEQPDGIAVCRGTAMKQRHRREQPFRQGVGATTNPEVRTVHAQGDAHRTG